jgi:hypothetical protein
MKKVALFFTLLLLGTSGAFAQSNKYDLNDDGVVDVTDVIQLVNYILGKENETHVAVDLGLPSGTKWASCNVGATKPEEYGGYYAWGETEEKEFYDKSTYKFYQDDAYVNIGSDISGTEYDVAHVKWGGNWCMPTYDDIQELRDNCTSEWTTLNGVNGRKFTAISMAIASSCPLRVTSGTATSTTLVSTATTGRLRIPQTTRTSP